MILMVSHRWAVFVASMVICISLTACGGGKKKSSDSNNNRRNQSNLLPVNPNNPVTPTNPNNPTQRLDARTLLGHWYEQIERRTYVGIVDRSTGNVTPGQLIKRVELKNADPRKELPRLYFIASEKDKPNNAILRIRTFYSFVDRQGIPHIDFCEQANPTAPNSLVLNPQFADTMKFSPKQSPVTLQTSSIQRNNLQACGILGIPTSIQKDRFFVRRVQLKGNTKDTLAFEHHSVSKDKRVYTIKVFVKSEPTTLDGQRVLPENIGPSRTRFKDSLPPDINEFRANI